MSGTNREGTTPGRGGTGRGRADFPVEELLEQPLVPLVPPGEGLSAQPSTPPHEGPSAPAADAWAASGVRFRGDAGARCRRR